MKTIYLRPHHGLCIQHYMGYGYNDRFVKNMNSIVNILNNEPMQEIILCVAADILCDFCPNKQGDSCSLEEKVAVYDQKCLSLCGFYEGQHLTWDLFQKTVYNTIIKGLGIGCVCKDCSWFSFCERVHI